MNELEGITPRFSAEQIAARVAKLGAEIRAEAGATPIVLIAVLRGSAVFLADLLRAIPGPVSYHFVDVVQEELDTETAEATELDYLTHFDMEGKRLYLLKDVVSTGVIESYLLNQFRLKNPADLKLVALLDRPAMRTVELRVDHCAFEVGSGTFVGYGLEYRGELGNLPYLATAEKRPNQ